MLVTTYACAYPLPLLLGYLHLVFSWLLTWPLSSTPGHGLIIGCLRPACLPCSEAGQYSAEGGKCLLCPAGEVSFRQCIQPTGCLVCGDRQLAVLVFSWQFLLFSEPAGNLNQFEPLMLMSNGQSAYGAQHSCCTSTVCSSRAECVFSCCLHSACPAFSCCLHSACPVFSCCPHSACPAFFMLPDIIFSPSRPRSPLCSTLPARAWLTRPLSPATSACCAPRAAWP